MTDPTPFLSTVVQTSAGMVAIVGGLLVARFISLESEQQGAQRLVAEAEERLAVAQERASDALQALHRSEADLFLDDDDILEAISDGITEVDELRRRGSICTLTDEELSPFVDEYRAEYERALQALDSVIRDPGDLSPQEWESIRKEWEGFRRDSPAVPVDLANPELWQRAFGKIVDRHKRVAQERLDRQPRRPKPLIPVIPSSIAALANVPTISASNLPRIRPAIEAQRRDALRASVERTEQQVEDIESELQRLRQRRQAIVKPDKQLWQGMIVLGVLSLLGVLVPLYVMSLGPATFGIWIKFLFWPFLAGYLLLIAYFLWFAWQLSRSRGGSRSPSDTRRSP